MYRTFREKIIKSKASKGSKNNKGTRKYVVLKSDEVNFFRDNKATILNTHSSRDWVLAAEAISRDGKTMYMMYRNGYAGGWGV